MDEPEPAPSRLDRLVERALHALASLGMNTTRLRWKWNRLRDRMKRQRLDAAIRLRGVTGRHRMCPSCRALVPVGSRTCTECGDSLAGAATPGLGRLVQWILPGIPPISATILSVNFGIFILIALRAGFEPMSGGGGAFGALFGILSFSADVLTRYGAGNNYLLWFSGTLSGFVGEEWWRLICPIFLHGGILHLLFNTYIFAQIAPLMEEEYGRDKFFVLYLTSGIGSFVASEIVQYYVAFLPLSRPNVVTVGASGAILGLVGAALVFGVRRGGPYGRTLKSSMIRLLIYVGVLGLLIRGVDNWAHLGGLATGVAFASLVPAAPSRSAGWRFAALLGAALAAAAIVFAGLYGEDSLERYRDIKTFLGWR